ncbi:site-specific recombinase, phage integrase family [Thiobacillus denitrificans ATCC 25259]|uniref:Site-specific recombinase, phage integrase family n=1 Tax=Thiobacillus denitrificans (strain ATCC 25259 / T1) TaxID=292415 RepID=Q3SHX2_THIDA|nr:site-specific integrase [Thiobacillus denitrificans]AAZ97761.1 site-specific recombinase, phage integrase family [Thiobacillus denitrificans ATCC 25259]
MATIRKRGELQWQAIVKRKGYPLQSKTWNTRKEAEAWARQIESEMDRGVFVSRAEVERTTLQDLIGRYRIEVLPNKRGKHFGPALRVLEQHLGKYSLAALSPKLIAGFRDKRTKAGLSASTVKKEINLLSKLIDLAGKEWGVALPANPCAMVSRPVEKNARDRRLQPEEEKYLLTACEQHVALLSRFALETAARLGELLALRWADVDTTKRVMVIRGIDERGTKSGDALRAVPLSPAAVSVLDELKKLPRGIDGRVFYWWKASDSFSKTWGRALTRAHASYIADCEKAGGEPDQAFLIDLRFHDLRHEATSRLFEKGVFDSMEVASITGHKTLAMLKRYTHLRAEDLAKKLG